MRSMASAYSARTACLALHLSECRAKHNVGAEQAYDSLPKWERPAGTDFHQERCPTASHHVSQQGSGDDGGQGDGRHVEGVGDHQANNQLQRERDIRLHATFSGWISHEYLQTFKEYCSTLSVLSQEHCSFLAQSQ